VRKVCELTTQHFITDDKPNVKGLILAGSAAIKTNCIESDMFDARLKNIVLTQLDVSYGQDNGLNQAITMAADAMGGVRFVQEKKMVQKFFENIATDTGLFVFGVDDTLKALDLGALETMLLYEDLALKRIEVRTPKGEIRTYHLSEAQEKDPKYFRDAETGQDCDLISSEPLADWLLLNYKKFGI
jgi:peptide chain release factor subunit 1